MDTALLKATVPSESGSENFEKKLSIFTWQLARHTF